MNKAAGQTKTIKTFINPAGFIEQHYEGRQTPKSVAEGVRQIQHFAQQLKQQNKPILILVDLTKTNPKDVDPHKDGARKAAVDAIRSISYTRIALYGTLPAQVVINTLALVAGKHHKTKAFNDRSEAIKWLKSKK